MSWSDTDDLNACAGTVERGDPARFRTVMAAPVAARAKLFPLYAFNVEVSRAAWVTAEPMIAEMRIQWWRDALEEIGSGGVVRRHEIVSPLMHILTKETADLLDEICFARRWDCYKDAHETQIDLELYLQRTSGNLMQVAAQSLGYNGATSRDVGFALGVANWLRAIPALEAQKRIPMVDGTAQGVKDTASKGLQALDRAQSQRISKQVAPAFWPALGVRSVLRAALKHPEWVAQDALPAPSRFALPWAALFGARF